MLYVLLPPDWLKSEDPTAKPIQGYFSQDQIEQYNLAGYNVYFYPNYPSLLANPSEFIKGSDVDVFEWVFVDLDMKHGAYESKEAFISLLGDFTLLPTKIVDSGNGIHAFWRVSDLDAMTYLKLQRRLMRRFNTDDAVAKIKQLMRVPNTANTKVKDEPKLCEELYSTDTIYSSEDLDKALPPITQEDDIYCKSHYNKTYNLESEVVKVEEKLPLKFAQLIQSNQEARSIWAGGLEDRSKGDYRLGHIMFANDFTKEEAMSVLINSPKALSRAPIHRIAYAKDIVDKIWTFEIVENKDSLELSSSVRSILERSGDTIKGTRFPCWRYLDDTEHGFRLGQVIGLVAGSGVGKTAFALNAFLGFVKNNPDYHHFFVPLEQPANEIAERWKTMCGDREDLYEKVHVISNYAADGKFRHLSFEEIREYIVKFQTVTGHKVGCVVIDHIGALKKKGKKDEKHDIASICEEMKSFAASTNTLLIMQSQTSREKAGIGDLELNKDAAYGTTTFEWWVDYLITLWQPLKRMYHEGAPTITAFKFCKIRHKKQGKDVIKEDLPYALMFDPNTELLRPITQQEQVSFEFFLTKATNKRKEDRKTDVVKYESIKEGLDGKTHSDQNLRSTSTTKGLH